MILAAVVEYGIGMGLVGFFVGFFAGFVIADATRRRP